MTLTELLAEWWPLLTAGAGVIIWGIRLEGLVKINKSEIDHLQDRVDRQDSEIKERLAKIDGRLETIASSLEKVIWRIPRPRDDSDFNKDE